MNADMGWASVDEFLPKNYSMVEVLCSDGVVRTATYVREQYMSMWMLDFDLEDGLPEGVMVTHWRLHAAV